MYAYHTMLQCEQQNVSTPQSPTLSLYIFSFVCIIKFHLIRNTTNVTHFEYKKFIIFATEIYLYPFHPTAPTLFPQLQKLFEVRRNVEGLKLEHYLSSEIMESRIVIQRVSNCLATFLTLAQQNIVHKKKLQISASILIRKHSKSRWRVIIPISTTPGVRTKYKRIGKTTLMNNEYIIVM